MGAACPGPVGRRNGTACRIGGRPGNSCGTGVIDACWRGGDCTGGDGGRRVDYHLDVIVGLGIGANVKAGTWPRRDKRITTALGGIGIKKIGGHIIITNSCRRPGTGGMAGGAGTGDISRTTAAGATIG